MLRTICVLAILFTPVASAVAQDHADQVLITLERTSCYGECPVYKITIRGDGSVDYQGYKFVRVTGKQKAKVNASDVEILLHEFQDINFVGLDDDYSTIKNSDGTVSVVTDLPTTIVSLAVGGRSKEVADYVGAPEKLKVLEKRIDELAGSKRWVFIDAPSVHSQCRLGWDMHSREAQKLFRHAAEWGDADVVKAFIEEGVDADGSIDSITPLQIASGVSVVKVLIDAGANVNATSKHGLGPPIERAAELGDVDSIQALLKAGAKVNGKSSDGMTALMGAAESGSPDAVRALLTAGADVRVKNNSDNSALDFAHFGLDRYVSDEGKTGPFMWSLPDFRNKFKLIEELLVAAGATPQKPTAK